MPKLLQKPIPNLPGIYLFKDAAGTVIYIGKAKSLKKRVATYFQQSDKDWKVAALLDEHADVDYILTKNETEALLLEAELIQKYKPKYNVLLKTGQPFVYILFTSTELPIIKMVRNKKEKGTYFGPFLHKGHARGMYQYLMRTFCLNLCKTQIANGCLDYHLGNCAGNCRSDFDVTAYLMRLQLAQQVLEKNHTAFKKTVHSQIVHYSTSKEFEKARNLSEYLRNIDTIFATIATRYHESKYAVEEFVVTTPTMYTTTDTDSLAATVQAFFSAPHPIHTIDCFDISHFQSHYIVGACIRFTDGKPDKNKFRRFKIKSLDQQNDYAALQEIVARRYKDDTALPDLVLIDGGKGQLSAAKAIIPHALCASLAKREETIFSDQYPHGIVLDLHTEVGKLLIALRDYAHHFAISYHRLRRHKDG